MSNRKNMRFSLGKLSKKLIFFCAGAVILLIGEYFLVWLAFDYSWPLAFTEIIEMKPEEEKDKSQLDSGSPAGEPLENTTPGSEKAVPKPDDIVFQYPLRQNILATIFWVGESASQDNDYISNRQSAWDGAWQEHFGGIDNPEKRNGYWPSDFKPKENPFYFALPYNDFNANGERKISAEEIIYWANEKEWGENEPMLKNRWLKIIKDDKIAYAQWEDVGPFSENDALYVFGDSWPKNKAGLDVSPAVADYLGLDGQDYIDWQLVDFKDVPNGPWLEITTSSGISWE